MLELLYEDDQLLVCRKPAGIPVQSSRVEQQDLVSILKNYRSEKGEAPEIYPVHRLDQPVEGIMAFAKTSKAAAVLSRQVRERAVDKHYLAVVEGVPEPVKGQLRDWILGDGRNNTAKVVKKGTKGAKHAVLSYQVLRSVNLDDYIASIVEIRLETGRHHQIRVQMAHAGHPLAGDKKYNPRCGKGYLPVGLCSAFLAFCHPVTGKRMEFSVEPRGEAFQFFRSEMGKTACGALE